jgi:tetratricopeptide (TPR) repeat protein
MCAESVALAPNHPQEARQWAELAVLLAPLLPGEQAWRWRVEGYCLAFLGNAERACNDLPAAERTLARARKLWEAGAPGDPGLLNEAWLPWIEAVLLRGKRRFAEALQKIDEALVLDRGELRGQMLVSKARIHETLGDPEASTAALLEAEPLIDVHKEPRLAFGVRFNLLLDLCGLDRAAEAAPRLPEIRALAESLGEELDLHRVLWLEGKAGAGLGRTDEALAAFTQVQSEFRTRELPVDYALVSLDLALVLLKLGRLAEVQTTAEEMLSIFKAQGVDREAFAALQVFCEAASREAVTVELIHRVAYFLQRIQLDPELRFEEEGAEAP